jgi:MFS family permease
MTLDPRPIVPDGPESWQRLLACLLLMTIGSSAMYVVPVMLPAVQADFGVTRGDASMPYFALMIGFGAGSLLMGRLADRFGVMVPVLIGTVGLGIGYALAAHAGGIGSFAWIHGVPISMLGAAATFSPLVADTALWFDKRRGIAVAICASGNYVAGALWPPVVQALIESQGWRQTYLLMAMFCAVTMPVLAWMLRRRAALPALADVRATASTGPAGVATAVPAGPAGSAAAAGSSARERPFGLAPNAALGWLCVAGVACCVAMSMPQVHIVSYCTDLGYGPARGAQMMALMLGFGIVSRLLSGAISDRIGGLRTLMLGSVLQGLALLLFVPFDGLASLYAISILFGLFQGGIVPSYAIIVREHFPAANIGLRVSTALTATMVGMALGGWASGKIFDLTGSYDAAFIHGIAWNLLNLSIAFTLWRRARGRAAAHASQPQSHAVP